VVSPFLVTGYASAGSSDNMVRLSRRCARARERRNGVRGCILDVLTMYRNVLYI
jgi:hypothetical protein